MNSLSKNLIAITFSIVVLFAFYQCKPSKDSKNDGAWNEDDVVLDEDFSDNSGLWTVGTDESKDINIANGHLTINSIIGDWTSAKDFQLDTLKDFYIETTIRPVAVTDSSTYGILLEDSVKTHDIVYYFLLDKAHRINISSIRVDVDSDYVFYNDQPDSVVMKVNDAGNTFAIERKGKKTTFFFNKEKITTVDNIPFYGNKIGYVTFNHPTTIEVDNIKISQK
jgi:hypothetical protein